MSLILVTYDLASTTSKDYTPFYEAIKESSDKWLRYITDSWVIKTSKTPKEVTDLIQPHLDQKKDFLFVARLTEEYYGWLPKDAWDWLKEQSEKSKLGG